MLKTGDVAPAIELPDTDMKLCSLAEFAGSWIMVYFYPKDDTPGCTTEANEFTALIDEFAAAGAVVLGVSKDSCEKHRKFIAKHGLKVRLLADTDGSICELYGTWGPRKFMGREYMGIGRSTFVIDKHGKLVHVDYKVKAKGHAQAILEVVEGLD